MLGFIIVCAAAFILALVFVSPLRRAVFSNPLLALYRRILPDMSQTEREAIDAEIGRASCRERV